MTDSPPGHVAGADPLLAIRDTLVRGDHRSAADWLDQHLAGRPDDFRAWGLLGRCRRECGDLEAAEHALRRSLQLAPGLLASRRELALLLRDRGDVAAAAATLAELLRAAPQDVSLWWELANLQAIADPAAALQSLAALRRLRPDDPEPALLQAQLLARSGQHEAAERAAEEVLQRQPDRLEALELLYWSLAGRSASESRRLDLSARIAALAPNPERLLVYCQELYASGEYAAAYAAIEQALRCDPDSLPARWAQFQLPSAPVPESVAAADAFRRQWSAGLSAFEAIDFSQPDRKRQVWGCVGQATAFYRHYLDDALDEQRRYGALVARMMATLAPGLEPRAMRRQRRRVGFCGAYFRQHTVTRLFGPLIEGLAAFGFELEVFALEGLRDGWDSRLGAVARVHAGPLDPPDWRALIAERELDVLVYPEIGMHPLAAGLAALRLAPVQAALWGHPVSSGLPSIDWLLSPDAMEPADGQRCYSERLFRLPGLGHGLRPEDLPAPAPVTLAPDDPERIDLLCAQTVFKLLPEHDALFGRILAALPKACLHLLADHRPAARDWLKARMAPVLRACGADPERQLRIHGFFPLPQFLGLAGACRLNLDSLGWSGGMSALDLLGQGLPVLTLEGPTMRTRQTAALLQRLELPELVASCTDDYVERAIALAADPVRLQALRSAILARRDRLFGSRDTLEALARFLAEVEPLS